MKYIKILGLLAVAVAALMAFAGVASATSITSTESTTPTIKATSTKTELHNVSLGVTTTCEHSFVQGTVEDHGTGVPATGKIRHLTFGKCNNHVTVGGLTGASHGSLSITGTATTNNGTLTATGTEVTIQNTSIGVSCIYKTNNTHIGTLTGGTPAKLKIESALIPRVSHSAFCGNFGQWTGEYTVTSPGTLAVH